MQELCNDFSSRIRYSNKLLTADGAILDTEELGFVIARDCGVRVDISWQHGQAGGQIIISRSHPFFF